MADARRNQNPQPGDLIEIFRGNYQHWAIYVGGGFVVHFVVPGTVSSSGALQGTTGLVMKQKLKEVVGEDRWRVHNRLDKYYLPHPGHAIANAANAMVDKELKYNLATYNCEHFATELRYGKPESRQVQQKAEAAAAGVSGVVGFLGLASTLATTASKVSKS
ncbi:phospholipase A and acyltransferase 3-like [Pholidichthys leucotaenia]